MDEYTLIQITGEIREHLPEEQATRIVKVLEGLNFINEKYEKCEPILNRLEQRIDDTEGLLLMYKNRIEAETDPEKKLILMEKIARYGTRMWMLKRIQNGNDSTDKTVSEN
jgi:hypothetical protein